jgi:hypothetical protein
MNSECCTSTKNRLRTEFVTGSLGRVPIGLPIAAVHPVVEGDVALVLEIGVHRELEQNALHLVLVTCAGEGQCAVLAKLGNHVTSSHAAHGLHVLDSLAVMGQIALGDDDLAVRLRI